MINGQQLAAALRAAANALDGGPADANAGQQLAAQQVLAPQPQPGALTVTADQLTQLITPHVGNETIKGALGVAMRGLGVNALAEAQPHQFGALFQAFQQVLAAHGIGGPAPQPAVNASII